MKPEVAALDTLADWVAKTTPEGMGLLLPVSGGSDSALAAYICHQAVGDRVRGVYFGKQGTMRCQSWFEQYVAIETVEARDENLDPEVERWAHVLTRALTENRVTVSTRNRTEHELGMYSMASRVASMHPLIGVWKSDIMKLCSFVGVPEEITASSKQADADCGRPAELAALTFDQVDTWIKHSIGGATEESLESVIQASPEERYLGTVLERYKFKTNLPYIGPGMELS